MDRIRKALDLARQSRARVLEEPALAEAPRPQAQPQHLVSPRALGTLPVPIVYTTTRLFSPAAEVLEANRVVDPACNDVVTAAFRMLRTQVLQRMEEKGFRSLAVLSPNSADGKTTTAVNLALSLASDHRHTVLLIDCDLKHSSVAPTLGLTPELGLSDVLSGQARVEQCLYHPVGFDRFVVLPGRGTLANSSEALSGPRGRELVTEVRDRYPERLVVFDLPPLFCADDALAFLPLVDCCLIVVAEGLTPREDLLRCMELVSKTPIVGTVLNRSTTVTSAYA